MKPKPEMNGISNASHICTAMGCARPIHPTLFMCTAHWRTLPEDYRKAYNTLARRASPDLADHQRLCIQFVAEQEGLMEKAG
jgi:hypothetical protein